MKYQHPLSSLAAAACLSVLFLPLVAQASVPLQVPVQGVLRDNAGVLVAEDVFAVRFAPVSYTHLTLPTKA